MNLVPGRRPWPGLAAPFWWAARALWLETFGFRFGYPIDTVAGAHARDSLHYYVYSERLFFDAMELDPNGIPRHRGRLFGVTYNPAYVAWYGLVNLEQSLRTSDPIGRTVFLTQIEWLVAHAIRRADGAVVWPYTFDWREGKAVLKAPWISAMAQGLAMSALVRGYRLTSQRHLLDLCRAATRVFESKIEDGGVRTSERGHIVYEEYPVYPLARVLDGFLFSLLGLYDFAAESGDSDVFQLFSEGTRGLTHMLNFWSYREKWTWYGSHGYLCPTHYHRLNCALLLTISELAEDPGLSRRARSWAFRRLSLLDKLEIRTMFLVTKNIARIRLRWT